MTHSPLFSTFKHIYEVDLIQSYFALEQKLLDEGKTKQLDPKKYLDQLKFGINFILDKKGLNRDLVWSHKLSVIVNPNIEFDSYFSWMPLFLYIQPTSKVFLILEYHFAHWNDKIIFLNNIEYMVLRAIEVNQGFKSQDLETEICNWLYSKRLDHGYLEVEITQEINESRPELFQSSVRSILEKKVIFNDEIVEKLKAILKPLLEDKVEIENLSLLIDGENIADRLKINKPGNVFVYIFQRLLTKRFIYNDRQSDIIDWVEHNFSFYNVKKKTFTPLTKKTIKQYLSGTADPSEEDQIDLSSIF